MGRARIFLDEKTFPEEVTKEFTEKGYCRIFLDDLYLPIVNVWDSRLYMFLKLHEYPKVQYDYYPNGIIKQGQRGELSQDLINQCLLEFCKGFKLGCTRDYYKDQKMYDLWPTNDIRQKKTTDLEAEQRTYHLKFSGFEIDEETLNNFGRVHGLYTRIRERMSEHGWEIETPAQGDKPPKMRCIALVYHESDKQIGSQNMDVIASRNGWNSPTSGKKIKDWYSKFAGDKVELEDARKLYKDEEKKRVIIL